MVQKMVGISVIKQIAIDPYNFVCRSEYITILVYERK